VINLDLTRTIARYSPAERVIEFASSFVSRSGAEQREILCHEAAHAVVFDRFGRTRRPHGPEWAVLVDSAGYRPTAALVRCQLVVARGPSPNVRYLHTCPVCHFSARAGRRMTNWRCPECARIGLPGELIVRRLV
jgi:predicted SprT family Zn-dependent metalloprotease